MMLVLLVEPQAGSCWISSAVSVSVLENKFVGSSGRAG
jgi:hypothetical protein